MAQYPIYLHTAPEQSWLTVKTSLLWLSFEKDFRIQHLGKDSYACQNSHMIVDHVLPLLTPLSRLTQCDKESFPSTVLDHDSNLNNTQCRISYTRPTAAKVSSLRCPSKSGASRPLRPPCLFPGSRFEHHLITPLEKDPQPPLRHRRSYSHIRRVQKSSQTVESQLPADCQAAASAPTPLAGKLSSLA
jgi:hypothetical protein